MMNRSSKNRSPKRWLNQFISLAIIAVFAVWTWFNNEKKSEPEPKSTAPSSQTVAKLPLGNYDTEMASDPLGQHIASTDYYQLALSWSPSFCEEQRRKNSGKVPTHLQFQCHEAATFGWVIHGLWPQNAQARTVSEQPRFCQGDLPPLPENLIKAYLAESPGAKLLQGQWEKHGACAFDNAESYFAKQKALFRSLNLPAHALSRKELFEWMKKYNPSLRNVRLSASKNELYICYNKAWQPMDCR